MPPCGTPQCTLHTCWHPPCCGRGSGKRRKAGTRGGGRQSAATPRCGALLPSSGGAAHGRCKAARCCPGMVVVGRLWCNNSCVSAGVSSCSPQHSSSHPLLPSTHTHHSKTSPGQAVRLLARHTRLRCNIQSTAAAAAGALRLAAAVKHASVAVGAAALARILEQPKSGVAGRAFRLACAVQAVGRAAHTGAGAGKPPAGIAAVFVAAPGAGGIARVAALCAGHAAAAGFILCVARVAAAVPGRECRCRAGVTCCATAKCSQAPVHCSLQDAQPTTTCGMTHQLAHLSTASEQSAQCGSVQLRQRPLTGSAKRP